MTTPWTWGALLEIRSSTQTHSTVVKSGIHIFQQLASSRMWEPPGSGTFQDLAVSSMWHAPDLVYPRIWHFPGCGIFPDAACSRMWQSPRFGTLHDLILSRTWPHPACGPRADGRDPSAQQPNPGGLKKTFRMGAKGHECARAARPLNRNCVNHFEKCKNFEGIAH